MRTAPVYALSLSLASAAVAAPVAFDNSAGLFLWKYYAQPFGPDFPGQLFDITAAPGNQPPAFAPGLSAVTIYNHPPSGNVTPGLIHTRTAFASTAGPAGYQNYLPAVPLAVEIGRVVDGALTFPFDVQWAHLHDHGGSTPATLYMLTSGGYVPAVVTRPDGVHYGWALFQYSETGGQDSRWQPTAWAYESRPNTPIVVNTPQCISAGDFNADGVVNFGDLNVVLSGFGGQYTFAELNTVLSNFGQACR